MNKIIAIVGMPGSGKTCVATLLTGKGLAYLRFGDITINEINNRHLTVNERNERMIREEMRSKYGMAAYAKFIIPLIKKELKDRSVIADGLYSWEEYLEFKKAFKRNLVILAIYASPQTRSKRLTRRSIRGLSPAELKSRDKAEIEHLNKGGPIAVADFTIVNESDSKDLAKAVEAFWRHIKRR